MEKALILNWHISLGRLFIYVIITVHEPHMMTTKEFGCSCLAAIWVHDLLFSSFIDACFLLLWAVRYQCGIYKRMLKKICQLKVNALSIVFCFFLFRVSSSITLQRLIDTNSPVYYTYLWRLSTEEYRWQVHLHKNTAHTTIYLAILYLKSYSDKPIFGDLPRICTYSFAHI